MAVRIKRRRSAPLLRDVTPDNYVVDTSAWIRLTERSDGDHIWAIIVRLIEQGRVTAPAQVLAELRDNPIYDTRLKAYEQALQAGDRDSDDPEYLMYVGRITREYPGMCKARGPKTPADPYVVALAELEHYVVVAEETMKRRPNRKIPGVCRLRGIRCLTLDELVAAQEKAAS